MIYQEIYGAVFTLWDLKDKICDFFAREYLDGFIIINMCWFKQPTLNRAIKKSIWNHILFFFAAIFCVLFLSLEILQYILHFTFDLNDVHFIAQLYSWTRMCYIAKKIHTHTHTSSATTIQLTHKIQLKAEERSGSPVHMHRLFILLLF